MKRTTDRIRSHPGATRKGNPNRWSARVMKTSDALDLEPPPSTGDLAGRLAPPDQQAHRQWEPRVKSRHHDDRAPFIGRN